MPLEGNDAEDEGIEAGAEVSSLPLENVIHEHEVQVVGEIHLESKIHDVQGNEHNSRDSDSHNEKTDYPIEIFKDYNKFSISMVDSDNFCIVMSALESVHIALTIMTHQHMPKQVYSEEIIDRIINFSRHQIVQSVFTAYDPSYRSIYKGKETDIYRGDEEEDDDAEYG